MAENKENIFNILVSQLNECQKHIGYKASISELIFITEVLRTAGTPMCNVREIVKKTKSTYSTISRHAARSHKNGLIINEPIFNKRTKFIVLTEKGEHLKARVLRIGNAKPQKKKNDREGP